MKKRLLERLLELGDSDSIATEQALLAAKNCPAPVRCGQLRTGRCVAGIRTRILVVSRCEPTVLLRLLDSKMANSLRFWLQSIFRLSF